MQKLFTGATVALMLILGACATDASRTFDFEVSPLSLEYTPGQLNDFLTERGFERVRFSLGVNRPFVLEVRGAETDEQRFRLKSAPQIELIVRLEKVRRTFGSSYPRVVVKFIENGRSSFSEMGHRHYQALLAQVVERVGADRVNQ